MALSHVKPTREMEYLAAERAREREAADDRVDIPGFGKLAVRGGGGGGFGAVLRQREENARLFPVMQKVAALKRALVDPGQAGTHENMTANSEAGFFGGPTEFSHSDAPAMNYTPPGYAEAGHRRPEDQDIGYENDYRRSWYAQQARPRMRMS